MTVTSHSSVDDTILTHLIDSVLIKGALANAPTAAYIRFSDQKGPTVWFARETFASTSGTGVRGYSDDGTELTASEMTTSRVTISPSTLAHRIQLTYRSEEDSEFELKGRAADKAQREIATMFDRDCVSLFGSFGNSVGTTNTANSVAVMVQAALEPAINNMEYNRGEGVFILHPLAFKDLEVAWAGTTATTFARYYDGERNMFMGNPIETTSNVLNTNGTTDVRSAFFISKLNADKAAIGAVRARDPMVEIDRNIAYQYTDVVASMRVGVAIIADEGGTSIVSKNA